MGCSFILYLLQLSSKKHFLLFRMHCYLEVKAKDVVSKSATATFLYLALVSNLTTPCLLFIKVSWG